MHVSRIWITWLTFLNQRLRALPIWPTRECIDQNMPSCFKENFPQTRVIIDCTEIMIEMPSSCRSQSATFSSYKNHNTYDTNEPGDQVMADRGFDIEDDLPANTTLNIPPF